MIEPSAPDPPSPESNVSPPTPPPPPISSESQPPSIPTQSSPSSQLPVPTIDPGLEDQPVLIRTAETLRYTAQKVEYTLSPDGKLRKWAKWNLKFALWLGIPAVLLIPPLVYLTGGIQSISKSLQLSVSNLLETAVPLGAAAIIVVLILFLRR